ncbi:MAG: 3-ketoacyl-(acyl-carrier-protein) reductase [uncultured bacterium]|nr:MAG: 3-ketoacyl-(acyl-carrier-protein) reductase [uncultured bacterium]OGT09341.1 MAG: 3-ketoacyl-ACP reductase [Gammaproteobacteria bacterium RBG_16_37_9]HBC71756.1 3-ketoacyl-ACP reductase [Coxiellaceae bacterium]HBS51749.1 3-ketoacyl-ACP reductase [Coxiellaceae bacterium]HBY55256.1 3-ketoacyl-ACP reductase [Coxiellaceae bacterium]
MSLTNKNILLTGAIGSLGVAQAEALSRENPATLFILDRPDAESMTKGNALAKRLGKNVRYVGLDLDDLAESKKVVEQLSKEVGGIDVLINNAALIINRPFQEFSLEEYEEQMRVNAGSAFALVQACAPDMRRKKYGKIINLCSVTLKGVLDGYVPYVASKGAILGLTKSLARELGPDNISVNCISPGAIVSESEARVFGYKAKEYNDWVIDKQCLKTRIHPEHVANLIVFLSGPKSDYITAQNIGIDAGW